MVFWVVTRCTL